MWGGDQSFSLWLASIGKGQLIYELFERETMYLVYNVEEGPVYREPVSKGPTFELDRIEGAIGN